MTWRNVKVGGKEADAAWFWVRPGDTSYGQPALQGVLLGRGIEPSHIFHGQAL